MQYKIQFFSKEYGIKATVYFKKVIIKFLLFHTERAI